MESVLLKANLVNLSTGQYWLKFDGQKGMSDREGHGHKAVLYKSQFPPLRHSFRQRHRCIHRLINHVYTKAKTQSYSLPHDRNESSRKFVDVCLIMLCLFILCDSICDVVVAKNATTEFIHVSADEETLYLSVRFLTWTVNFILIVVIWCNFTFGPIY